MGAISLRLPESLHRFAREVASDDDVSLNQLITTALAEKLSALKTESYLRERADRGSRRKFERVLRKISKRPPDNGDELP